VDQLALADLAGRLPARDAWVRLLIERVDSTWVLRHCQVIVGPEPKTWPSEVWRYESVTFVAARMPVRDVVEAIGSGSDGQLAVAGFDVLVPVAQPQAQLHHRPSFELHDPNRAPLPSYEYTVNRANGSGSVSTAGRVDFLVGPDSPSFTDLDAAYRGFFLGKYNLPANESVPSDLLRVRVLDERAWLDAIHIRATEMSVDVRGNAVAGTTLEYFSPERRERYVLDGAGQIRIGLPEGLPASNTWLWLTEGTSWRDYRALTPPWASRDQLKAAGVEKEQTSRDEQAAAEAVVYGGEGPLVEFKMEVPTSSPTTASVFKTIAAFANGAGGTVVFGVGPDELTVVGLGRGVDMNKERDRIGHLIRSRVIPTPDFQVTHYAVDGMNLLFLEVEPGSLRPYGVITHVDSRDKPQYYVRRGASTNGVQLRGCDFEGGRPVVEDLAVLTAFDGPVARAVAFDHPRVCAVSTFVARVVENFVDDAAVGGVATAVRGESPRSHRLRGGSPAGIA
jgi:schlafen family protein